ncbi:MAG TPA: plastocyanin/azurin family copper-binding protein [Candidatus Limnocylindrales bacterium]|jgi:plastocyanin|nr:plastocyanin/azurin family copper-binding protein [Candidatus Limnocylindrales bacterium]
MSRPLALSLTTLALLGSALIAAPAAVAGDPCFHSTSNRPATTTGATTSVAIGDCVFAPTVTVVPVGATVTWRNTSFQGHEVVGSNLEWGAHDKVLQPGDSIGWTFDKAGVFAYSCMLHPGMTGTIVVGGADVALASNVEPGAAKTAPSAGGTSPAPLAVAGGAGLLLGALGAGLLLRRRQDAN